MIAEIGQIFYNIDNSYPRLKELNSFNRSFVLRTKFPDFERSMVITMSRKARMKSESGIYHILMRGKNRQDIFKAYEDRYAYLERMLRCREKSNISIFAYCMMNNHVHLLVKEGDEDISQTIKNINASYAHWFNKKYEKSGSLFQDRYLSEQVENDDYFLTVLRFIHQNPVRIGMPIEYFTSYEDYLYQHGIIDTAFALEKFDQSITKFAEFVTAKNDDICLDISEEIPVTDDQANEIIKAVLVSDDHRIIFTLSKKDRNDALREMKEQRLSIRQIERLTGVNRGVIQKA